MFLGNGYAGTSIPAVAAEAGVSAQSVYKAFGSKGGLLKAVFDVLVNARGWSPERYGAWVTSSLTHALLPPG